MSDPFIGEPVVRYSGSGPRFNRAVVQVRTANDTTTYLGYGAWAFNSHLHLYVFEDVRYVWSVGKWAAIRHDTQRVSVSPHNLVLVREYWVGSDDPD